MYQAEAPKDNQTEAAAAGSTGRKLQGHAAAASDPAPATSDAKAAHQAFDKVTAAGGASRALLLAAPTVAVYHPVAFPYTAVGFLRTCFTNSQCTRCTAAIVDARVILTTANCVRPLSSLVWQTGGPLFIPGRSWCTNTPSCTVGLKPYGEFRGDKMLTYNQWTTSRKQT